MRRDRTEQCIALSDSMLWCGLFVQFVHQGRVGSIGGGQVNLFGSVFPRTGCIPFESEVENSRPLSTNWFTLQTIVTTVYNVLPERTLTKKSERLLMLAKAATRKGYSVTSICPSNRLMSSCGLVDSASEKSMMLVWLAYIRRWSGVVSPLPSWFRKKWSARFTEWSNSPSFRSRDLTRTFCVNGTWMMTYITWTLSISHSRGCTEDRKGNGLNLVIHTWISELCRILTFIPAFDDISRLLRYV